MLLYAWTVPEVLCCSVKGENMRSYTRLCPHCSQEVTWPETPTYPFCSERCRLIDLGAWASGDYRIPGEVIADEEAEPGTSEADE
jgi:endogenous inhibitor of DNA gyrase (YacG/DUF329 family)